MSGKVERVLVQGTVTFQVSCNDLISLVDLDLAHNGFKLEEWLRDKAIQMISSASVDVEIDHYETVNITKDTANNYTNTIIGDDEWKKIKEENKEND